jgi:hypothetical protein
MTDYNEDVTEDWGGFSGAQTDIEDQSLHPATVVGFDHKRLPSIYSKDADGKDWTVIWKFALEDIEGQNVDGTTSEATGPKSKARPWLEALLGKDEARRLNWKVPTKMLIGRQCQVLVTINDNGYPKVSQVLPLRGARRTAPEAQARPDTAPDLIAAPGPSTEPTDEGSTAGPEPATDPSLSESRADSSDPENTSTRCSAFDTGLGRCERETGHPGNHRGKSKETWR